MPVDRIDRVRTFVATTVTLGFRLLFGAIFGLFAWGLERWVRRRDWRVLGALFRIVAGGLIGWAIWWNYVRPIDPHDPVLLLFMLRIGCTVGAVWAMVWLVFMQPSPLPPPERKHEGEEEPPLER